MSYFRPNVRVSEILKNEEAVAVLKKYVPELVEIDPKSAYVNCSLFRTIRDDYPEVDAEKLFEEMEMVEC